METILNNKRLIAIVLSVFILSFFIHGFGGHRFRNGMQGPSTISVNGKGEVTAVSDIATIYINLSKDGKTAKEAQDLLNTSITKTLEYLKSQKIEDKDIKSDYGGLNPKYSYEQIVCIAYPCPTRDPKITGYTATQSITVKVRAVDTANDIKTGLAKAGVENISGPTFGIDDQDALNDEARAKAIEDARTKAKILAKQLGVRLGKVSSFSENGGAYPMMYMEKSVMASDASSGSAPAPTLPKGENKITVNVTVTYEIY